ncbi:hypothetical protein [Blastococcus brunescens]|uniref:Uncharacterized protein n=1 Tax=Blastococcus brunescens TaxID=1564165 RepID=A0ABZ1B172_9ACTN|nr:hypothetical protein [Blastococcus sp. BMG 8361]WRL64535.1 hypothetical protein U6N30_01565 [Blastococcus sp. BMG 8361]
MRSAGARALDVDVVTVTEDDGTPVLSEDLDLTLPHPGPTSGRSCWCRG